MNTVANPAPLATNPASACWRQRLPLQASWLALGSILLLSLASRIGTPQELNVNFAFQPLAQLPPAAWQNRGLDCLLLGAIRFCTNQEFGLGKCCLIPAAICNDHTRFHIRDISTKVCAIFWL